MASPPKPDILAAHYGGMDVTEYAKSLFPDGDNLKVDTRNLPFLDPWLGVPKTLSIVYNVHGEQTRVFVALAEVGGVWTLTSGDINNEPNSDQAKTYLAGNYPPPAGSSIWIVSVVYGRELITDPNVYAELYRLAANQQSFTVSNELFKKDTWPNVPKSAAITYSVMHAAYKSVSGHEGKDITHWWV